jgi:probable rRNA maturation factor
VIHVANRSKLKVPVQQLAEAAEATLEAEKRGDADLSIAVVTDAEIHLLNRQYLKHNYPTDVISFPLHESGDPDTLLGEVILSADRARHEARARGLSFEEELCRYVVHGTLHLLGYDDREAAAREKMIERGEEILRRLKAHRKGAPRSAALGKSHPKAAPSKPKKKAQKGKRKG